MKISPYWRVEIELIAYRSPKPVSIRAVQPATPITVISRRDLYRKRLRQVTLPLKESRFQKKVNRSSRIRLPFFGAFGRISWAGAVSITP